jgi:hypothetical protein
VHFNALDPLFQTFAMKKSNLPAIAGNNWYQEIIAFAAVNNFVA